MPILRDGVTGDWIGTFIGHQGAIWCSRLSPDSSLAVTASADYTSILWSARTGEVLATLHHSHIVRSCDFAPFSTQETVYVVTGDQDKNLRLWRIPYRSDNAGRPFWDPQVLFKWSTADTPKCLLWVNDSTIVCATYSGRIQWWHVDLNSSAEPKKGVTHHLGPDLGQIQFTGDWIITAEGQNGYIFNASNGSIIRQLTFEFACSSIAVNPARDRLAMGSSNDTWVRVYELNESGTTMLDTYKGHHGPVHTISYSPDGAIIASGSEDGTIRLWKATNGRYGLWQ